MGQYAHSVTAKGRHSSEAGLADYPGKGKKEMVQAGWIEVCALSNRGFLSEQKLGCEEVKELGNALSTGGRPGLARMSVKEIINL